MGLDGICMAAVACELRRALLGGRVDKITQPDRWEVILAIHSKEGNQRLLLSAQPGQARAQLTQARRENPAQPPVFCMLLRKHLAGARLLDIVQEPGDRRLRFVFDFITELGDSQPRHLILEAIGRGANLILTDGEDRILACVHRLEGDLAAGKRQVMPGLFYQPPEPHPGVPPLLGRELEFRGKEPVEAGLARLRAEAEAGQYAPTLLVRDGKPVDFSFLPILQYGPTTELVSYPTFGALMDDFYAAQAERSGPSVQAQQLIREVKGLRERLERKLANQAQELAAARDREGLRLRGDLLTANLYRLERGQSDVRLENYYDPAGGTVDVALDPLLTPQQNAARYYKDYARAKTAEKVLTGQLQKGREELDYLESVAQSILFAQGERDLEEIRRELQEAGFLRQKKAEKRRMKAPVKPMEFVTTGGFRVSVGKNNTQNDHLTGKLAGKDDWWFHVQKAHGSHVILWTEGKAPDDQSLTQAAGLAAYYSQARGADKVAVDYTPVKYVKKPAGARPGMVVYTTYQTAYVQPISEIKEG